MKPTTEKILDRLDAGEATESAAAGFLGCDIPSSDASLVLVSVPWEPTVSYGSGTAKGPEAIRRASHQLDVFDEAFGKPFRAGIAMVPPSALLKKLNLDACKASRSVRSGKKEKQSLAVVNKASRRLNTLIEKQCLDLFKDGKVVGIVGGDHSSPYGLMKALGGRTRPFGILHVDAHMDLRNAYEGFEFSHASIMFNAMRDVSRISKLVQVGVRDFSAGEFETTKNFEDRCSVFTSHGLFARKAGGESWKTIVESIIDALPEDVYISFDIDGLDPALCPSTGTPVAGGLSFEEAVFMLETLVESKRKIIGFDLCEVAPGKDEWDGNVGARMLYKLCGACLKSNNLC